ncbi:MAG: SNF2-related protein [Bacteroidaceae bacterium]|nr:SNF2-related protein [Bacteroidaceae bacterium]
MSKIYDNIGDGKKFKDILDNVITEPGVERMDFCVGYFNLRGWDFIADEINELEGEYIYEGDERVHRVARLLIGMQQAPEEIIRMRYRRTPFIPDADYVQKCRRKVAEEFHKQLLIGSSNAHDETTLRMLCSQLQDGKLCVKLFLRNPLHAKLYLAHNPKSNFRKIYAFMGSSNLTYSGLTGQGELNAEMDDSDNAEKLYQWFCDRWEDKFSIDITEDLIDIIQNSWAANNEILPYHIYLKTAYLLSQDARTGIAEYTLPPMFKKDLFEFQETAVKIAAKHLNNDKRSGAMIGDVVGLGKTITACAIAKVFEQQYYASTLIICPANLQEMWDKYIKKYDLKADVTSMQKKMDVDNMKYYKLVIIDESHNLRNSEGARYHNIKDVINKMDCKVLLLTATPYNKDFSDLGNQLKLFLDPDADLGIRPELYIKELGGDRQFIMKHNEVFIRSIRAFEQSCKSEDWRELMKLFLVRRTRTFIKENYALTDETNGRKYLQFSNGHRSYFPDRIPSAIKFVTHPDDQYSRLYSDDMIDIMKELKLPRYGLSKYIDEKKVADAGKTDKQMLDNLSRAGHRMMGFCMSTFFKRIDSCGFSFLRTLYRHILRNMVFIYAIDNKLKLPISDENALPDDFLDDQDLNDIFDTQDENDVTAETGVINIPTNLAVYEKKARDYYNLIATKGGASVKRLDSVYFKRSLKTQLKKDCETIIRMIEMCGAWETKNDQKLNELEKLIAQKHPSEKILVFTQYSDTADYIYKQLEKRGVAKVGCVTGDTKNPTAIVDRFSPKSNNANVTPMEELRVIIATDVLSEGQNLQDAHIIVNYDMPWAIIRLIQRAGRVDRIGQEAEKIMCYSFFPAEGVEKVIKLRKRLNDRINENADVVGSDEIFFEGNAQNLQDLFNEKAGSLDDEDDSDVDMASYAYQIWKNATDANPELKKIIPAIPEKAYTTKANPSTSINEGVVTYAKTASDSDMLTWVDKNGRLVTQSQLAILKAMSCSVSELALQPLGNHHELVDKALAAASEMSVKTNGALGSRFSTKYKVVTMMEDYMKVNPLYAIKELKEAVDQMYNFPMREQTKYQLGVMLRRGDLAEDFSNYLVEMYNANQLCVVTDEESGKESRVICSMGLKNED